MLQRACSIGMSRGLDLDAYPTLADMPGLRPVCFSMQPDVAPVAFRNRGSDPRLRRPARGDARRGPRLSRSGAQNALMTSAPNASSVAGGAKSANHT